MNEETRDSLLNKAQGHLAIQVRTSAKLVDIPIIQIDIDELNSLIEKHFLESALNTEVSDDFGLIIKLQIYEIHKLYVAEVSCHDEDFDNLLFICKIAAQKIRLFLNYEKDPPKERIEIHDYRSWRNRITNDM